MPESYKQICIFLYREFRFVIFIFFIFTGGYNHCFAVANRSIWYCRIWSHSPTCALSWGILLLQRHRGKHCNITHLRLFHHLICQCQENTCNIILEFNVLEKKYCMFWAPVMDLAVLQLYTFVYDQLNLPYIQMCDAQIGKCYTSWHLLMYHHSHTKIYNQKYFYFVLSTITCEARTFLILLQAWNLFFNDHF